MTDESWKVILYMTIRPLSQKVYSNIKLEKDFKKIYDLLKHHKYRCFVEYFAQQIAIILADTDLDSNQKTGLLFMEETGKYRIDPSTVFQMLDNFILSENSYICQDGQYLEDHEAKTTKRTEYIKI
jgi:hypothetical protein